MGLGGNNFENLSIKITFFVYDVLFVVCLSPFVVVFLVHFSELLFPELYTSSLKDVKRGNDNSLKLPEISKRR